MSDKLVNTLNAINPKNGDKYSPNIFKWVKRATKDNPLFYKEENLVAYRDKEGCVHIGFASADKREKNWISGRQLEEVLGSGGYLVSRPPFAMNIAAMLMLANFWSEYIKRGRCAIDKDHVRRFIGDENRWHTKGNTRTCQWCGKAKQKLVKRKEVIIREDWVSA